MPGLINYTIPERNFEPIRDQIGAILFMEFENQYLNYNPNCQIDGVYVERKAPIDKEELAFINVTVISGAFDNKSAGRKDGIYQYAIDVFAKKPSEEGKPGDQESQIYMERLLGICDYILEDPQYKTLGFAAGAIGHHGVVEMQIRDQNPNDASNVAMGRLIFTIKVIEVNALKFAPQLLTATTAVSLNDTQFGYKYEYQA